MYWSHISDEGKYNFGAGNNWVLLSPATVSIRVGQDLLPEPRKQDEQGCLFPSKIRKELVAFHAETSPFPEANRLLVGR